MWYFYRRDADLRHNSDVLFPNLKFLYFATATGESCCGSLCLFGPRVYFDVSFFPGCVEFCPVSSCFLFFPVMPNLSHTMPDSDEEVQDQVEAMFGFHPCPWQIHVVHAIQNGNDVITIAPTGSRKSMTYWMPVLFIKYGISVIVTPLKLLGAQFSEMLGVGISAILITAANATLQINYSM